jgi:hypothetical protein
MPNSTRHEAEIVTAAFSCALAVYEPNTIPSLPGFIFKKEASISPSIGGTTKATEIYVVKRIIDGAPDSNSLLPMLVIAIRGTASRVDSMVNMNGDSRELDIFVSSNFTLAT